MLNFDPENMNMEQIYKIAQNADNLINLITNIKQKVDGPPTQIVTIPEQQLEDNFRHATEGTKLATISQGIETNERVSPDDREPQEPMPWKEDGLEESLDQPQ